ncbi:hypothetical protein [Streptomyces sp. NPDC093225]|uniref:hypothetical protein n=1 Tax=Streptomyces sp. NPDC093225 TaxID=3366034 RepID=UPI0038074C63
MLTTSRYGAYMHMTGERRAGTALLLAASPVGKSRLIEASSVMPTLAAVPPAAWLGTEASTLVELTDPVDPQAVLTRIRGAAACQGPLTIVLVGQLHLDRRQHAVHLALGHTSSLTMRYTALPWAWAVDVLRQRRPGTTTLHLDLVADAHAWQHLHDQQPLALPEGVRTYGVIAPPPPRRQTTQPMYTQALAALLRAGHGPDSERLHSEVLERIPTAGLLITPGRKATVGHTEPEHALLSPTVPSPVASRTTTPAPASGDAAAEANPHDLLAALSKAGRHQEAAALAAVAEERAISSAGPDSTTAVHWLEVRAHLAAAAGEPEASCALWIHAAEARLKRLHQAADAEDVVTAVDRAHYQWNQIRDPAAGRALAPRLVVLRRGVPGRQREALAAIQKRLELLQSTH